MPKRKKSIRRQLRYYLSTFCTGLVIATSIPAQAAELIVQITGISEDRGKIGCALFSSEIGFPMDNAAAAAASDWQSATGTEMVCRFADVSSGSYAISVGHDTNGNQKVDTNFFGMPTEQWGVSNNIRPTLRAPNFDEAKFNVSDDAETTTITIEVAK